MKYRITKQFVGMFSTGAEYFHYTVWVKNGFLGSWKHCGVFDSFEEAKAFMKTNPTAYINSPNIQVYP